MTSKDTPPPSRSMRTNELLALLQDSIPGLNKPHYISEMLQLQFLPLFYSTIDSQKMVMLPGTRTRACSEVRESLTHFLSQIYRLCECYFQRVGLTCPGQSICLSQRGRAKRDNELRSVLFCESISLTRGLNDSIY